MDNYKLSIERAHRRTTLAIEGNQIFFRCTIGNAYRSRNRRQFLLTIYRAILPHLDFIKRSTTIMSISILPIFMVGMSLHFCPSSREYESRTPDPKWAISFVEFAQKLVKAKKNLQKI